MNNLAFLLNYVQGCFGGRVPASECGAVWHLVVIAVLLLAAIATLVALRVRARLASTA